MQIHGLMTKEGDSSFYEQGFLNTLNDHYGYLRSLSRSTTVTNQTADKYHGDFFGLLDYLGLPKKYHTAALLINGLLASSDYRNSTVTVWLPDTDELDLIKSVYETGKF